MNANHVRSAVPMGRITAQAPQAESSAQSQAENPLPDGTEKRSAEDHATEPATKQDRTAAALRLWDEKWKALERCRVREEELADAGLLVQPLIATRVRLSYDCLAIIRELQWVALQRLLKQSTVVGQSGAQAPADDDDANGGQEYRVLDVSNSVPAVKRITTDPMSMLWGLLLHSWAALERCRWGQELLHEKGLPTHCLVAANVQLLDVMGAFLAEDRRDRAQAFFIRQVVGSEDLPPTPLSPEVKRALKETLRRVSPKHRRVLRELLDRAQPSCSADVANLL